MRELLQNLTVQFILLASLTLLGVTVTVLIAINRQRVKALTCGLRQPSKYQSVDSPILSVDEELKGEVQILYKGTPVPNMYRVGFFIENTGNVPIEKDDFQGPLTIGFGDGAKILSMVQPSVRPRSLKPDLTIEPGDSPSAVVLQPLLLNPRDWMTVFLLVTDFKGQIFPSGRISGISDFTYPFHPLKGFLYIGGAAVYLAVFALVFGTSAFTELSSSDNPSVASMGLSLLAFVPSFILFMIGLDRIWGWFRNKIGWPSRFRGSPA